MTVNFEFKSHKLFKLSFLLVITFISRVPRARHKSQHLLIEQKMLTESPRVLLDEAALARRRDPDSNQYGSGDDDYSPPENDEHENETVADQTNQEASDKKPAEEGGSVPLTLSMPHNSTGLGPVLTGRHQGSDEPIEVNSASFMTPQSQHDERRSNFTGGINSSEPRSAMIAQGENEGVLLQQSVDVGQSHSKKGAKESSSANPHVRLMPAAPLLESALSQKQFIIKKQAKTKRGSSKGATLMKAYFPNLIAKKEVNLITPTNAQLAASQAQPLTQGQPTNQVLVVQRDSITKASPSSHALQSQSAKSRPKKFIRQNHQQSRSQHGSQNSTSGPAVYNYVPNTNTAGQVMAQGEIIMPADYSASGANQRALGKSQHLNIMDAQMQQVNPAMASQDHPQLRKQYSQVRSSEQQLILDQKGQSVGVLQKRARRNSLAEGGAGGATSKENKAHMLPPIFSGPQKKQSQKSKNLAPLPNRANYRSQVSEASPMRYKSEQHVIAAPGQSQTQPPTERDQPNRNISNLENVNVGQLRENDASDEEGAGQGGQNLVNSQGPKVDFVSKNAEKLRLMQEQRAAELKNVEEQRAKLLRRQEKLKQNVLKDAQAYRQRKAQREASDAHEEIKLGNVRNEARGMTSPVRATGKSQADKAANLTSPSAAKQNQLNGTALLGGEDEKTAEEKAEEKKKMDMMRKFYRNRHTSFLQALVEQKAKKEQEEKAKEEAAEKRKQKITQKVLGDGSRIRSKLFDGGTVKEDEERDIGVPQALQNIGPNQLNSTSLSTTAAGRSTSKHGRVQIKRGNSVSSLSAAERAYNDTSTVMSSGQKRGDQGSRGSQRAASTKGTNIEKKQVSTMANRSAQNFNRGRTLTPKVASSKASAQQATKDSNQAGAPNPDMTPEERLEFDENREEEILKAAAAKKARALAIRERQEKQLQAIKDKVNKQKESEQAELDRKKKLQDLAREQVQQRAEQIKNLPSLREQQDSRLKLKRNEEGVSSPPTPVKPKATVVDSEAFNNFLERNKTMMKTVNLNITDMKEWKKKNRVEPETKVFIIRGGYGDVKRALKSRGWVENKDKESPCFDFLWTLMTKDVPHNDLQPHQIANHFPTATSITTKVGLTHSLKNLIWFNAVDIDTFYPRCYDLAIKEELDDFIQEFKQIKAVSYMKIYLRQMREAFAASGNSMTEEIKSATVTDKIYKVALKICKSRTRDLDDLIDDPNGFDSLVSEAEWQVLSQDEHSEESLAAKKHKDWINKQDKDMKALLRGSQPPAKKTKKAKKEEKVATREKTKAAREKAKAAAADDDEYGDEYDDEYGDYDDEEEEDDVPELANNEVAPSARALKDQAEAEQKQVFACSNLTDEQKQADKALGERYPKFAEAVRVLDVLREKYPQFNIDGERNIWIMKPAGSSRGRGICLKRDLCEILDMIKFKDASQAISNQKNGQLYICQKYIENTLIMKARKFDIRQWVLVTDWNPLTIWVYSEPYIRFPAADFDFSKISNRYSHLSNNSVAKHGKKVTVTHHIDGNMWDLEQFQSYLLDTYGHDVWEDKLLDSIKNIVINSLESVQDNFESRKGLPFEIFGYDIMVDDDFNCWLIEVNSSPAMDYSTDVTERLVKMVLEDTVKVVIDYGMASAKKQKKVDTGGFECVYKAKRIVDKPMNSFGLNMEIVGKKIPKNHLKKY